MQQEKYGFVYIWRDRKHNRYYIGSHWGHTGDGYICSSSWMKQAYRRRPDDFKRRVIKMNIPRDQILYVEQHWLSMIPKDQLGKRYYNLNNNCLYHWTSDPDKRLTVGQKISNANKGREVTWAKPCTEERKRYLSEVQKGQPKNYVRSEETRAKIAANSRRLQAERRVGMHGRQHSEDTKKRMSENNAMHNPIHRQKVAAAKKGIRRMTNGVDKKMAVPGTEKFDQLVALGYWFEGEQC